MRAAILFFILLSGHWATCQIYRIDRSEKYDLTSSDTGVPENVKTDVGYIKVTSDSILVDTDQLYSFRIWEQNIDGRTIYYKCTMSDGSPCSIGWNEEKKLMVIHFKGWGALHYYLSLYKTD